MILRLFHAPSRREVLLTSVRCSPGRTCRGWRALKAATRGCSQSFYAAPSMVSATVAPVGDRDWVALRGDNALTLERQDAGAQAQWLLRR